MTPLELAAGYCARGWRPIPIPRGAKAPTLKGWEKLRLGTEELNAYFNGQPLNIGVLLGEASGGLVDVDLDCAETVALASTFLPATACRFGRASRRESHWLYLAPPIETEPFKDVNGNMLVEVRSSGVQTVFPGSAHPSGELIEFSVDGQPTAVTAAELRAAVVRLAVAAILARHWPASGSRHETALAAAGFLLRAGLDEASAVMIISAAARTAGDSEWRDRTRAVRDTAADLAAGQPVTGGRRLADQLTDGEKVVAQLRKWLGAAGEHPPLTEFGLADRFVTRFGDVARYCRTWREWVCWTGQVWKRDAGDVAVRLARQVVVGLFQEAAQESDEAKRKSVATFAMKAQTEPMVRRLLILAQAELTIEPTEFDRDLYTLNTPSGILELRTLHLRPHDREAFCSKITAAPYESGARHPMFDSFLERVLPDEDVRTFVQRVSGYCLTAATTEEALFTLYGPTAGGKSTYLAALKAALGAYGAAVDASTLMDARTEGGQAREDLAKLVGKRLVVCSEVRDGARLAETLLKGIAGGDELTVRGLYERAFTFKPQLKVLIASNYRPRARDDDDALWRRIREIPFTESIPEEERDPAVKAVLCDPAQAGAAILAWAAEGAAAWFEGGLHPPAAVRQATAAYRKDMDPLEGFLADCCTLTPTALTPAKELRQAYEAWAREQGLRHPLAGRAFGDRLRARGCEPVRRTGGARWWSGIELQSGGVADGGASVLSTHSARAQEAGYLPAATSATSATEEVPAWVRE